MSEQRKATLMIILIMFGSVGICVILGVVLGDDMVPGRRSKIILPGSDKEEQSDDRPTDLPESDPTPDPETAEEGSGGIVMMSESWWGTAPFIGGVVCLSLILVALVVGGILLFQPLEKPQSSGED